MTAPRYWAGLAAAAVLLAACSDGGKGLANASEPLPAALAPPTEGGMESSEALVRASMATLAPGMTVGSVEPAPVGGWFEVDAGGRVLYVSADGKHLFDGVLVDIASRSNLTERAAAGFRLPRLAAFPATSRVVFSPESPAYRVTVFTDPECGFCRKLHEHIGEFMDKGIAIEYVPYPRGGMTSTAAETLKNVWCSKDPQSALTAAKRGEAVTAEACDAPIQAGFELGNSAGVSGTPAMFSAEGVHLGGYMTPDDLLKRLEAEAASAPASEQK